MNIPVDTCMLDRDSSLLQQGADITGGLYVKVPNIDSLFQFLVWIFLPDASSLRKQMGMPSAAKVHLFKNSNFAKKEMSPSSTLIRNYQMKSILGRL